MVFNHRKIQKRRQHPYSQKQLGTYPHPPTPHAPPRLRLFTSLILCSLALNLSLYILLLDLAHTDTDREGNSRTSEQVQCNCPMNKARAPQPIQPCISHVHPRTHSRAHTRTHTSTCTPTHTLPLCTSPAPQHPLGHIYLIYTYNSVHSI